MMCELRRGANLPERCHVVLPGLPAGANVALCVLGEAGVRLTLMNLGDTTAARCLVRAFNASLGINADAERAMLAGCLGGWGHQRESERSGHHREMRRPMTAILH